MSLKVPPTVFILDSEKFILCSRNVAVSARLKVLLSPQSITRVS